MALLGARPAAQANRRPLVWGAALWLATAVFFIFIAVCARFYDYFPADLRIAHAIQGIDVPAFGGFMHFINAVGDTTVYILLVVVLVVGFAVLRAGWESVLVFLTLVPNGIGVVLKSWVGRPRPSSLLVHVTGRETDASFPSGHTLKTAALFAVLVFVLPAVVHWRPVRWALMAVCLVFVAAAGPARVYVGAHWPSDTLGSYLVAFLCLAPLVAAYLALRRWPAPGRDEPRGG